MHHPLSAEGESLYSLVVKKNAVVANSALSTVIIKRFHLIREYEIEREQLPDTKRVVRVS